MFKKHSKVKLTLIVFLVILIGFVLYHNIQRAIDVKKLEGAFEYIEIEHNKMHVYDNKEGEHTIVLLSGYGTGAPIVDFKPLIEALEVKHRVIVIEYFGYGYSADTTIDRTIENITHEIHAVIKELGVSEPYILMPHSISGIYSHYYLSQYPDEVEALIGNENAVPLQLVDVEIPKSSLKDQLIQKSGAIRLVSVILPSLITPDYMSGMYDETSLKLLRKLTVRTYHNHAQEDEMDRYQANGKKALLADIPKDIPMLFFLSKDVHNNPDEWMAVHKETLAHQEIGIIIELDGPHYLHRTFSKEMAKEINDFINEYLE